MRNHHQLRPGSETNGASTLEGILERVAYVNEENAWSVVRLMVPGKKDLVTAIGNLLGVQPGENLRLRGRWIVDRKYGEQFKADGYVTVKPATLLGIEKYLGSGLVRGIGKVMAGRLVECFGLSTLEVIEQAPERLREVDGIGPVRSERIAKAWVEQKQIKDVMVFLQSHGVSTVFAIKIYKHYQDRSIAVVKENPYRLAIDIFGIGFKTADKVASQLGISRNSPERAQAGVLHVLGELSSEGHVFCPRRTLIETVATLLEVEPEIVETAVGSLAEAGQAVVTPIIGDDGQSQEDQAVYLASLHRAERGAAELARVLVRSPGRAISIDVERAIAWFEERQKISLAPEQREAIRRAAASKFLVITGGPGTGKTTLVNGIIQILEKKGRRILLAAPTGRAAKRMTEATGREAKTLHRLLEFDPRTMSFLRDRERPLEADLMIVDEASMLDTVLAYNLLKAVPRSCQLVLVGDVDQLPSVGPGNVLRDVISSGTVDVVRLQHIFRQAEASLIVVNAHMVNRGEMPRLPPPGSRADFFFVEKNEPEEVLETLKVIVKTRIPEKFGFHPVDDVQVLTPMHRGLLGAMNLNVELQSLLNHEGASVVHGSRLFRAGDKVMQIRNNYDLEVFNGDIGRIDGLDETEGTVSVQFDGRLVTYERADLDELVLAYACSIHKSQGSEYPCVVLPIHTQHYVMLQRNLLYTGITRARRLVVLVGTKRALAIAVKNDRTEARFTQLAAQLRARGA
ncbi:MAG TPA: ATP-dependent RecD-like DNA helicase [Anaeromyxobacteraceae bacterium]|nr:ATP-dependent RecD-like DNA helicase [Anaeromyxobacteraceae bacterium]